MVNDCIKQNSPTCIPHCYRMYHSRKLQSFCFASTSHPQCDLRCIHGERIDIKMIKSCLPGQFRINYPGPGRFRLKFSRNPEMIQGFLMGRWGFHICNLYPYNKIAICALPRIGQYDPYFRCWRKYESHFSFIRNNDSQLSFFQKMDSQFSFF